MYSKRQHRIWLLSKLPVSNLFNTFYSGRGSVVFMHKIVKDKTDSNRLFLNAANEVTVDYLERLITYLKNKNYRFISLDQLHNELLSSNKSKQKFICFTFDDGYKDNLTLAYPVFKKHNIPFAIYITNCFPNKTASLWWYFIEDILLKNDLIELTINSKLISFSSKTIEEKEATFFALRNLFLKANKSQLENYRKQLEEEYSISEKEYVAREALSWKEISELSKDSLVTIGCHTANHLPLNQLTKEEVVEEIQVSKKEIEKHINKQVHHFAYPFGTVSEIGKREVEIAKNLSLFKTATTTRTGNIFATHKNHLLSLPRIQVLGTWDDFSILNLYLSGVIPAIKNKFKKTVIL